MSQKLSKIRMSSLVIECTGSKITGVLYRFALETFRLLRTQRLNLVTLLICFQLDSLRTLVMHETTWTEDLLDLELSRFALEQL